MGHFNISRFEVLPRRTRAKDLVPLIRQCSKRFKKDAAAGDIHAMQSTSHKAWNALTQLFEILRNEQDQGRLAPHFMHQPTAHIVNGVSSSDVAAMISARKIDKSHVGYGPLNLRNTLNKIAHHDTSLATYRIDGRGAHYLVLGGAQGNTLWVAEILVSRLCKNAAAAVGAIR
jgi:hypothetical protein